MQTWTNKQTFSLNSVRSKPVVLSDKGIDAFPSCVRWSAVVSICRKRGLLCESSFHCAACWLLWHRSADKAAAAVCLQLCLRARSCCQAGVVTGDWEEPRSGSFVEATMAACKSTLVSSFTRSQCWWYFRPQAVQEKLRRLWLSLFTVLHCEGLPVCLCERLCFCFWGVCAFCMSVFLKAYLSCLFFRRCKPLALRRLWAVCIRACECLSERTQGPFVGNIFSCRFGDGHLLKAPYDLFLQTPHTSNQSAYSTHSSHWATAWRWVLHLGASGGSSIWNSSHNILRFI